MSFSLLAIAHIPELHFQDPSHCLRHGIKLIQHNYIDMKYDRQRCWFKHFITAVQSYCLEEQTPWAASSEFVSSSIPSWKNLTAHAQSFRGARGLAFCLKVPLDSLLVWASSGGSGETARMRRFAWTFAARIGDKYQIRLTRPRLSIFMQPTFLHKEIRPFWNNPCSGMH